MTAVFHSYSRMAAALAAIDDPVGFVIDRRHVLGADITLCFYPHGGDAASAKIVFREEFVGRWFAMPAAMGS